MNLLVLASCSRLFSGDRILLLLWLIFGRVVPVDHRVLCLDVREEPSIAPEDFLAVFALVESLFVRLAASKGSRPVTSWLALAHGLNFFVAHLLAWISCSRNVVLHNLLFLLAFKL
jgi:hypothetical protein